MFWGLIHSVTDCAGQIAPGIALSRTVRRFAYP